MSDVKYGLRDDVPIVLTLFPPNSSYIVEVRGHIRNVIDLVNIVGWKMSSGRVDIDEFLEWQRGHPHREQTDGGHHDSSHDHVQDEPHGLQGSVKE